MTACEPIILFLGTFYPNMEFSGIISENLPMLLFKKKSSTDFLKAIKLVFIFICVNILIL